MVFVLTLSLVSSSISAAAQEITGAAGSQTEQGAADIQSESRAENPEEMPSSGEQGSTSDNVQSPYVSNEINRISVAGERSADQAADTSQGVIADQPQSGSGEENTDQPQAVSGEGSADQSQTGSREENTDQSQAGSGEGNTDQSQAVSRAGNADQPQTGSGEGSSDQLQTGSGAGNSGQSQSGSGEENAGQSQSGSGEGNTDQPQAGSDEGAADQAPTESGDGNVDQTPSASDEDTSQGSSDVTGSDTENSDSNPADASQDGSADESREESGSTETPSQEENGESSAAGSGSEESMTPDAEGTEGADGSTASGSAEESAAGGSSEEPEEEAVPEVDYTGLPTLEELENLPEEEVGATMWLSDTGSVYTSVRSSRARGALSYWSFDAHYVNQNDPYDVEKDGDFSLKYQMEFHTDGNLEPGTVEIRIPLVLLNTRERDGNGKPLSGNENGKPVIPSQIAVPQITKEQARAFMDAAATGGTLEGNYTENRVTSFNCYIDEINNRKELVFFNYKTLTAGSNAVWQVLYSGMHSMDLVDGSEWTLDATAKVGQWQETGEGSTEGGTTGSDNTGSGDGTGDSNIKKEWVEMEEKTPDQPMTGRVNTSVKLSSVAKEAYTEPGSSSYTPGLYTKSQIERYIGTELPDKYLDAATGTVNGYKFALWEVRISGEATQPWSMSLQEAPAVYDSEGNPVYEKGADGNETDNQYYGEVVGYLNHTSATYDLGIEDGISFVPVEGDSAYALNTERNVIERSDRKSWGSRFWIVTAYEAQYVQDGYKLDNGIQVEIIPLDTPEKIVTNSSSALWGYESYDWTYKGDVIGIEKVSNPGKSNRRDRQEKEYRSWLEAYQHAQKNTQDYGNIKFYSEGTFRGYGYTHVAPANEEEKLNPEGQGVIGAYKEGTSYEMIMADDIMYAYYNGEKGENASAAVELDYQDYYYSSVTITQQDTGYDVYEDCETAPNYPQGIEGIGREVEIYAMFAESENPTEWELVGTKGTESGDWDESGTLTYTFNEETIARKPWRVKVVHRTVEYKTVCNIDVTACIRQDSPVMTKLLEEENLKFVQLEDLSTVMGKVYRPQDTEGEFLTFESEDFNYENYSGIGTGEFSEEKSLKDTTRELYGIAEDRQLPQRSNAWANLYQLNKEAASYKLSSVKNDERNGRALVTYYLTTYDGYAIYDQEAADYLMSTGEVASPGKNAVMFYDLLPEGVYFDPSVQPTAGRITRLDQLKDTDLNCYKRNPDKWNSAQVSVTVDSDSDVIENWNGTGRTMVIFHIAYEGADPSVYTDGKWMEGWGLSFRAYYEWKDAKTVQEQYNISAFMPDLEKLDDGEALLLGENDQVYTDGVDAEIPQHKLTDGTTEDDSDYKVLKPYRLNALSSGKPPNVLYAKCNTVEDIATASASSIEKTVRADADPFAAYDVSAYVGTGAGYTYNVTVKATAPLKDIVVYDHLENAAADRGDYESDPNHALFADSNWHGSFLSVETGALTERGIKPTVYYNKNRNASITTPNISQDNNGNTTESGSSGVPKDILTEENGWYTEERIKEEYIKDDGKKTALDTLKEQWKSELTAQQGTVLKLTENAIAAKAEILAEAYIMKEWGVQSVAVDMSKRTDGSDFILEEGDSVSFRIHMEAPTTAADDVRLTAEQKAALAGGQEIYALNNPSYYSLSANAEDGTTGQTRLGDSVRVTLSDKYIYEVVKEFDEVNGAKVPDALRDTYFRFRIYRNSAGKPGIANKEYTLWEKVASGESTAEGENEPQWIQISASSIATDANGYFQLKAGQKAVFLDMTDAANIKVEELTKDLCWKEPSVNYCSVTETNGLQQITATVTNRYRQVIYVRKDMAGTPGELPEAVCRDFVFRITLTDKEGNPVSAEGNLEWWRVRNEGLSSGTPELWTDEQGNTSHGIIGDDGLFTVPEGAVIALFSEETDAKYQLEEMRVRVDENGKAVLNDEGKAVYESVPAKGIVTTADDDGMNLRQDWICNRPELSGQFSDTGAVRFITNYYRWKDLYLIKTLKNQEPGDCAEPFTFRISKENGSAMELKDVEWELISNDPNEKETVYRSTENAWELWKLDGSGNPERPSQPGDDVPENGSEESGGDFGGSGIGGDGSLDLLSLDVNPDNTAIGETTDPVLQGKLVKRVIRETATDGTVTTKEVIEVTALCAGKAIRISGLEMGAKYLVEEVVQDGSFYLPETALQEATMSVYSASQSVRFINDYRKRSLTVSKQVVSDSGEAVAIPFEMVIARKVTGTTADGAVTYTYEPMADQAYILSGNGAGGSRELTDKNGKFSLQDGQTATFKELGVPGEEFVVWEIQNAGYPQIYPAETETAETEKTAEDRALDAYKTALEEILADSTNNEAAMPVQLGAENKAMLSEAGADVRFINGSGNLLVINKQYTGEIHEQGSMFGEEKVTLFEDWIKEKILPEEIRKRLQYTDKQMWVNAIKEGNLEPLNASDYIGVAGDMVTRLMDLESSDSEEYYEKYYEEWKPLVQHLEVFLRWTANQYDVKVRLTVGEEEKIWTPDANDTITCIDQYFGTTYQIRYNESAEGGVYYNIADTEIAGEKVEKTFLFQPDDDGCYTLKPGMLYILPMSEDTKYVLTESPESAYKYEEITREEQWMPRNIRGVITQRLPKEITGTVKTDPLATITNEFKQFSGSLVTKIMTSKSKPVGEGKQLVWRVDEYDEATGEWKPAAGVEYVILEGKSEEEHNSPERLESTGTDGRITLSRSADGNEYLAVQFVSEKVFLNIQDMTPDMMESGVKYRVVEVPEESHEDWGVLVGYTDKSQDVGSILGNIPESLRKPGGRGQLILTAETVSDGENSSAASRSVEEKEDQGILLAGVTTQDNMMRDPTSSTIEYSMDLPYQRRDGFVNSNVMSPVEIEKAKLDAKYTGATFTMILYQIFSYKDAENKQQTRYEPQAGIKYTIYDSATGKLVEEDKFTGSNGEIVLKDGQYARLNLPAELRWAVSENQQASPDFKLIDLNPKQSEDGSENSFITSEVLVPGDNLMLIDFGAPTRTIVLTEAVLKDGIEILSDGEWKFIRKTNGRDTDLDVDMQSYGRAVVSGGGLGQDNQGSESSIKIVDADEKEVFEVNISESIRWNGLKYKVVGIGDSTFSSCNKLTVITIPNSVTTIGEGAFWGCSSLTSIVIPPSVKAMGEEVFMNCSNLQYVYFYPNAEREIANRSQNTFFGCNKLTGIYFESLPPHNGLPILDTIPGKFILHTTEDSKKEIQDKLNGTGLEYIGGLKDKIGYEVESDWPAYPALPTSWTTLLNKTTDSGSNTVPNSEPDSQAAVNSGLQTAKARSATSEEGLQILSDDAVPKGAAPSQGNTPGNAKSQQSRSASSANGVLPENNLPFGESTQSDKKKRQTVIKAANEMRERGNGSSI